MADMGEKEGKTKIQKLEYLKNEKSFLDEIKGRLWVHETLILEIIFVTLTKKSAVANDT